MYTTLYIPCLCTHYIYAFDALDSLTNSIRPIDAEVSNSIFTTYNCNNHCRFSKIDYSSIGLKSFVGVRSKCPNGKFLIGVGGWDEGAAKYSKMMASSSARAIFIQSIVNFLSQIGFDGIDFYIQYPGNSAKGGRPQDFTNLPIFIKQLRKAFNNKNKSWQITMAVPVNNEIITAGYDVPKLCSYVKIYFIRILTLKLEILQIS